MAIVRMVPKRSKPGRPKSRVTWQILKVLVESDHWMSCREIWLNCSGASREQVEKSLSKLVESGEAERIIIYGTKRVKYRAIR